MSDALMLVLVLVGLGLGAAWLCVPFILMGTNRRLDELLDLVEGAVKRLAPEKDEAPPLTPQAGPIPPWEKPSA